MTITNDSIESSSLIHQQIFVVEGNARHTSKHVIGVLLTVFLVYINSLMFHTLLSKPVFRELPRYILFAHMLCNDSFHVLISMSMYLMTLGLQKIPKALCALILLFATTTFNNAPLNLAVMSLERYVAICFPLRHSEIVNQKSASLSICFIWFVSSLNIVIAILYSLIWSPVSFKDSMFCVRERILNSPWQLDMSRGFNIFFFTTVTAILVFTYVNVVIVARSASSQKDSAKKAQRTILLHLGQLLLCVNSFIYGTIERVLAMASSSDLFRDLRYLNFLFVLLLPRCLSPLIYGLRDDAVRPLFFYYASCGSRKVKPSVTVH
ncbi:odorant receptor 131-2-like [Engraulis encrasicolus]|uniref:odorant receptor 131-2-like n=1 Tax=Engraulis encrasicolus TaxID=184585 RepID=UPI002FCF0367